VSDRETDRGREASDSQRSANGEWGLYRRIVDNGHEGIAIIQDRRFVYCNDRFAGLHDTTPDDLEGREFLELVAENERETAADRYEQRLAGDASPKRVRLATRSGHVLEVSGTRIEYEGRPAVMVFARDVTEDEEYEQALHGLHTIAIEFPHAETNDEIAARAVDVGTDLLGVDTLRVCLFDEAEGVLETIAVTDGDDDTVVARPAFAPGDGPVWTAFSNGEAAWIDDPSARSGLADAGDVSGVIVVPLGEHGVMIADVTSGERDDTRFELVETLAATTTAALDRAEREGALRRREQELEAMVERIERIERYTDLFRRVVRVSCSQPARTEIERAVCEVFVKHGWFDFAWVGRPDRDQGALVPQATAGDDRGYLNERSHHLDADGAEPTLSALRTGTVQVVGDTVESQQSEPWRRTAAQRGFRNVIGVPLQYGGASYGVLGLYNPDRSTASEFERALLADTGKVVAAGINASNRQMTLLASHDRELDFEIADLDCFLYRFASDADCTLTFDGIVPESPGENRVYVTVDGDERTVERFHESVRQSSVADRVDRVTDDATDARFEFRLTEGFIGSVLAAHGLVLEQLEADEQSATVTVGVPSVVDTTEAVAIVTDRYQDATLVAKRTVADRPDDELHLGQLLESLTERQREVLERAYHGGYFDSPKGQTGDELARTMDISSSTFHDHVTRAQQAVFEALFENP